MQFSFTTIGDESVIGGFNIEQLQIGTGQSPGLKIEQSQESRFNILTTTVHTEHTKILHSNVDSFNNKKEELLSLIEIKQDDIIALTEVYSKNITDYDATDTQVEWKMRDYQLFVSPNNMVTRRGCLIYVKEELETFETESKTKKLWNISNQEYTLKITKGY